MTSMPVARLPQEVLGLVIQSYIDPFTVIVEEAIPFPSRTRPKLISNVNGRELNLIDLELVNQAFYQEVRIALRRRFDGRLTFRGDEFWVLKYNLTHSYKLGLLRNLIGEIVTDNILDDEEGATMVLSNNSYLPQAHKWTIRLFTKAWAWSMFIDRTPDTAQFRAGNMDSDIEHWLWRTSWRGGRRQLNYNMTRAGYGIDMQIGLQVDLTSRILACRTVLTNANAHGRGLIFTNHEVINREITQE